ncbi:MAG: MFS transporter, partial [Chloroflexota bacterium]|nr:MFS transporter [Chloroflexota bacterium]
MTFKWIQLVVISSGVFLSSLDVTVNVALPIISDYFDAEPRTVYLMITFYLGTGVALQLGVGRAGDLFGLRNIFLVGLVSYTIAMIAIGLSPTIESVIVFRILQAVGNASLLAISPALATSLFPSEMRGRALGVMTGIGTLGMVAGTLSAGLMLEYVSWHWIFLGRLPICLRSIIGTIVLLKEIGRN